MELIYDKSLSVLYTMQNSLNHSSVVNLFWKDKTSFSIRPVSDNK